MRTLLGRFSDGSRIPVEYEAAAEVPALLLEQIEAGETPDVILLPIPNWLRELAAAGAIPPLSREAATAVRSHFGDAWVDLVSHEGSIYGVPFDANAKSLLWYRPEALAIGGLEEPRTLDDLFTLAAALDRGEQDAFAVAGGAGWPLTDWFENVLLASAGAQTYDDLLARRIAWTDPMIEDVAQEFAALLRDEWVMGGAEGAATLPLWPETFYTAFEPENPGAAMWLGQGSIIQGYIAESDLRAGKDYDLMPFPADGAAIGVGSVAVGTNAAPQTMALLTFLAQPEAVEPWVQGGSFISPNRDLALDLYPSELARHEAELLVNTGLFRYDLSDQLPPNLRDTFLPEKLREMLLHPDDIPDILKEIEQVATREQGSPRASY